MYEKTELEEKIVAFLKSEETPTNINAIALNIGISFGTCKKILKQLIENEKIVALETSRCTLFAV